MDRLTLWSLISPSYKVEAIPVSHFFFFFWRVGDEVLHIKDVYKLWIYVGL